MDPLFPCHSKRLLEQSMIFRHLAGFLTLFFFVVIIDEFTDKIKSIFKMFLLCCGIYIWFVLSSKMTAYTWMILIFLLAGIYLLDLYSSKELTDKDPKKEWVKKIHTGLLIAALSITAFGVILYMGEKKFEYGSSFDYVTFFLGTSTCSDTVVSIPIWKALRSAFK